jgi:chromosome segregation ATPase
MKKMNSSVIVRFCLVSGLLSLGLNSYAEDISVVKSQMQEAQAGVEAVDISYEEAASGVELTKKDLEKYKSQYSSRKAEYNRTVVETERQIDRMQKLQIANAAESARLATEALKYKKETKKLQNAEAKVRAKTDATTAKLSQVRSDRDQSVQNYQENRTTLAEANRQAVQIESDYKHDQAALKSAQQKERASLAELKKQQALTARMQAVYSKEAARLEQQTRTVADNTEKILQRTEAMRERQRNLQERLKQKKQRLSDARELQQKAMNSQRAYSHN